MDRGTGQFLQDPAGQWVAALRGERVAIVGFGNQGRAQAQNLRDSGVGVVIGGREGSSARAHARALGFDETSTTEAVDGAMLVVLSVPDEVSGEVWRVVEPVLAAGAVVGCVCGAPLRYGLVQAPSARALVMVAPKGPGVTLRDRYLEGRGIPALACVHQAGSDPARARSVMLGWAGGIGCGRAGVLETTAAIEAETDLFGEQAVLCGGMVHLMMAAFETLVDAGYPAEVAYIECIHELKQVADLIYTRGIAGMRERISNTAEFGIDASGPLVVDAHVRARLREVLDRVRDGSFASAMLQDQRDGSPGLLAARRAAAAHSVEAVGNAVRSLMPWLSEGAAPSP